MPTGSVWTAIPTIDDLKALPAGDLAVGTLYLCAVKHPVDDLYSHAQYCWHDYADATGDMGSLVLQHDTESGFFLRVTDRIHYGTGAPSGTFPVDAVTVLNKLGAFTWVDTSTSPYTWYDYTVVSAGVAGTWVQRPVYSNEQSQDAVGNILTDTGSINFTYDDSTPAITASAIFGTTAGTVAEGNHGHTSSSISDFSEAVDDRVNNLLVAGSNVTLTYDDTANTITIAATGGAGYTDEQAQDAVGNILTDSSLIDFTYNDATPSITASVVAGSIGTTELSAGVNTTLTNSTSHIAASAPHAGHEATANKNQANGYAGLDSSTLVPTDKLATGTPDSTKFLRGDRVWAVPPGGGGGGTPSGPSGAIQYESAGAFAGSSNLTWDNTNKILTVGSGGGYKLPPFTVATAPSAATYVDCIAECSDHLWSGGTGGPVYSNGTNWVDMDGSVISTTGGIATSNLAVWYDCSNMTGTTLTDKSGNGRHGTLTGSVNWVTGIYGRGLSFDGGYVDMPDAAWCTSGSFTIEIVYRIRSQQDWVRLLTLSAGAREAPANAITLVGSSSSTRIPQLEIPPGNPTFFSQNNFSTFRYLLAEFSASTPTIRLFEGMNLVTTLATPGGSIANVTRAESYLGRSIYAANPNCDMYLAEFRFYDRVLTVAEKSQNFRSTQRSLLAANIVI